MHRLKRFWLRFWLAQGGLSGYGRLATRIATWAAPAYKARVPLSRLAAQGYIAPEARVQHRALQCGQHIYLGERVTVYQDRDGGAVTLADKVHLYGDSIIETGEGGSVTIGAETHVQPRCQFSAYKGSIRIGQRVEIAPNCAFYPYNHSIEAGTAVREQPLQSRGDIVIGDDVWLGFGVIVLDGVTIGAGAVVGAGSVVTKDIPANGVAMGAPARVVKIR